MEVNVKRFKGVLAFLLQWVALLMADCLMSLTIWFAGPWYKIAAWGLMPLFGMAGAYWATVRGVNNYLAWLASPVCAFASHWLVAGFTPDGPGPTLLSALLAIIGAAAGDVVKRGRAGDRH